ncbi:MAG: copper amine oxidase N-terminal domain-containing protein [Anaeromicrobium sp.]|uniref:stalk domain-containing protein n=1 Tax=Anaeromicrobium sp. TaxID=1929132 RepID=UPI0025F53A70|nr:stalk domain-containing protein [Anaeromicrobium sp.]MCT4595848.1 copper amine oxidase N-terminal domain-containing protein [Anaeromicrobium sp.]
MKKLLLIGVLFTTIIISFVGMSLGQGNTKDIDMKITPQVDIFLGKKLYIPKEYKNGYTTIVHPIIYEDRVYLSIKDISHMLGLGLDYDYKGKKILYSNESCIIETIEIKEDKEPYMDLDMKVYLNKEEVNSCDKGKDYGPIVYKGKIYIPIRYICEKAEKNVFWNGEKNRIVIDK